MKFFALFCSFLVFSFNFCLADNSPLGGGKRGKTIELKEITVTPYRYPSKAGAAFTSLTVLSEEDFKAGNAITVLDALESVPGLLVRDWYGNAAKASIDIRGFGEQAGMNSAVLINSRRVNEVDLSGVDWSQIPLDQISRIEIVRGGSGAVLYGDNAVAGVVNLITKKGKGPISFDFETQYGSYDMNSQRLSLSGSKDKLAYWLSSGRMATHGYRNNSFFKAYDFASNIYYDFCKEISFHFSNGYHRSSYGLPGNLTPTDVKAFNRRYSKYGEDYAKDEDYYFDSGVEANLSNWGKISLDISFRKKKVYSYLVGANAGWNPISESYIETYGLTPKYTLEKSIFGHDNKLIVGVDLYRYDYSSDTYNNSKALQDFSDINKNVVGLYCQNEFMLCNKLKLIGGYRKETADYDFDYHDNSGTYSDVDSESSPHQHAYNLGLVYQYSDKSSIFFNASRSFRFPATDEYFTWGSLNLELKPQESSNYEAGVRHNFNEKFNISLAVFRMDIENELYYNPNGGPFGFGANENYDKTCRKGLEIAAGLKVNKFIKLFGSYDYTKAVFKGNLYSEKWVPMVPRDKASAGAIFTRGNFQFNITANFVGTRYYINDQKNKYKPLGSYLTCDLNLKYAEDNWEISAGVNNLFADEYNQYGVCNATTGAKNFYPSPTRNFLVKTSYKF